METFSCRPAGVAAGRECGHPSPENLRAPVLLALTLAVVCCCAISLRAQSCAPAPTGLVGLWQAENSGLDLVSGAQGKLVNNTSFTPGFVGQAFKIDGYRSGIVLDDSQAFHLQDFTIEAWIRRDSPRITSSGRRSGEIFSYGHRGYALGIEDDGSLFLTKVGIDNVTLLKAVTDTSFHHVAVTKAGSKVVFYVDGRAYPMPPYHTKFEFSTAPAIGTRGDHLLNSFMGTIDEVALYNRPLRASEVKSIYDAGSVGKCMRSVSEQFSGPSLTIALSGTDIILSWPAALSNFYPESCSSVSGDSWSPVGPNLIVRNGAALTVTLPIASGARFYRLKSE